MYRSMSFTSSVWLRWRQPSTIKSPDTVPIWDSRGRRFSLSSRRRVKFSDATTSCSTRWWSLTDCPHSTTRLWLRIVCLIVTWLWTNTIESKSNCVFIEEIRSSWEWSRARRPITPSSRSVNIPSLLVTRGSISVETPVSLWPIRTIWEEHLLCGPESHSGRSDISQHQASYFWWGWTANDEYWL